VSGAGAGGEPASLLGVDPDRRAAFRADAVDARDGEVALGTEPTVAGGVAHGRETERAPHNSGVASSFGIREFVWRPGSVAGPLIAGWLMVEVSTASVFYVGGAFAVTGVLAFLAVLAYDHGRTALTTR